MTNELASHESPPSRNKERFNWLLIPALANVAIVGTTGIALGVHGIQEAVKHVEKTEAQQRLANKEHLLQDQTNNTKVGTTLKEKGIRFTIGGKKGKVALITLPPELEELAEKYSDSHVKGSDIEYHSLPQDITHEAGRVMATPYGFLPIRGDAGFSIDLGKTPENQGSVEVMVASNVDLGDTYAAVRSSDGELGLDIQSTNTNVSQPAVLITELITR